MGLGWAWMVRQKLVGFCGDLWVCFCEAEGCQGVQAEGRPQIFDQLPHLQGLAEPRRCFPCDAPSGESWGQDYCLSSLFFPQEIFCNTVIDMYHQTKQVTNLPLPSEVSVIKKSYPGMKWSSSGVEESCIKFLYVAVWILHMGVSLKAVFFSHDIILCFAYKWWWVSSIRLSRGFRKLGENKMKRKPKQSFTFPWYVQEWLFLPASYVFTFSSFPLFENRHIFAEIQKFWLHSVYASLYTGESLVSVVPSILCLLFVSGNERWGREPQMKSWAH